MVFQTSDTTGKKASLYTLEMYNGKNTLRTLEQLKKHVEAIELWSISDAFGVSYGHQVLCVFEQESLMEATVKRIQDDTIFTHVKSYFLFKTLDKVMSNPIEFGNNWQNLERENISLYTAPKEENFETNELQNLANF